MYQARTTPTCYMLCQVTAEETGDFFFSIISLIQLSYNLNFRTQIFGLSLLFHSSLLVLMCNMYLCWHAIVFAATQLLVWRKRQYSKPIYSDLCVLCGVQVELTCIIDVIYYMSPFSPK